MNVYMLSTVLLTGAMLVVVAFALARCASHATRAEAAARRVVALRKELEGVPEKFAHLQHQLDLLSSDNARNRESVARLNGRIGAEAKKRGNGAVTLDAETGMAVDDPEFASYLALQKAGGSA